jgi:hypothetical protein
MRLITFTSNSKGRLELPRGHKYRIDQVGSKHHIADLYARIDWGASKRIIQLAMRRFEFYGHANEPSMDLYLAELYEIMEAADQEEDDDTQIQINEMFREKLLVQFLQSLYVGVTYMECRLRSRMTDETGARKSG